MSVYHLHARLIEGPLAKLERDELRSAETDDQQEIVILAKALVAQGFTVWIYEHGPAPQIPTASDLTVVAHLRPEPGQRRARGRSPAGERCDEDAAHPPNSIRPWPPR
jgi:hypothetical protein